MKYFLVLVFLCFSFQAHSFQGYWTSKENGKMDLTQNGEYQGSVPCHEVQFQINLETKTLSLSNGYIYCGHAYELTFYTYDFSLENGKVFSQGEVIGEYTDKKIIINQKGEGVRYFKLVFEKKQDDKLYFQFESFDSLTLVQIQSEVELKTLN